ncbi:hypothetical protein [Ligilactobacillus saerimneri]
MMNFEITVNGVAMGEFENWQGESLWQAMSEEIELIVIDPEDEERLAEWQNLPDDDIHTLLEAAKTAGFIDDYEVDEIEDEEE